MELIKIENGVALLDTPTSKKIAEFEKAIKELKEKEEEIKNELLSEMEDRKILGIENDDLKISYVAPTTREKFDSKKLKEDNPDLYDEYISFSDIKSSIRIKVK